ncbi:MAG: trimethylamine corrinoid protein 2 [Lentisphaerae bacterium]|nr:MAG: trimethylamine corrinoid protein 2 [Lentisphaerota bacterium]
MTTVQHSIMPIENIDDWNMRLARQDAFWQNAIIDRPVIHLTYPRTPAPAKPPEKNFASHRERWLDSEYQAALALHRVESTVYAGDALPMAFPNLGPEVFSAWFGTPMEYGETTSWSIPNLKNWDEVDQIKFDRENFYWKKMWEMTEALLEFGKGKFYVGYTDIHPGGDAIAAFRDPQQLNLDLIEVPEKVIALREAIDTVFCEIFTEITSWLRDERHQAICSWPAIVSTKRYHVPSNDFSCMISPKMFRDYFLPGIIQECRSAEANVYHLDGPNALRHLDALLEVPEINAIQWVFGAGNGTPKDWLHVYKRCQEAGKGLQISPPVSDLPVLVENLDPHGVWLGVRARDRDEADYVMDLISRWH